jgi:hypothetical protein
MVRGYLAHVDTALPRPRSTRLYAPAHSSASIRLRWTAHDPTPGSGIAACELQVREWHWDETASVRSAFTLHGRRPRAWCRAHVRTRPPGKRPYRLALDVTAGFPRNTSVRPGLVLLLGGYGPGRAAPRRRADGCNQSPMIVTGHELHALQPACFELAETLLVGRLALGVRHLDASRQGKWEEEYAHMEALRAAAGYHVASHVRVRA